MAKIKPRAQRMGAPAEDPQPRKAETKDKVRIVQTASGPKEIKLKVTRNYDEDRTS